mmetsp:Transcript_22682/g.40596  ORF Transcript_22682/g.40596 Transcript_22682/m.40596 type:complete len:83 (-) Transcript_22682:81-329(-)
MVADGALLKNGVAKGAQESHAVGATPVGHRYLITECMLQASTALNVSLHLQLKADQASKSYLYTGMPLTKDDVGDDISHHMV